MFPEGKQWKIILFLTLFRRGHFIFKDITCRLYKYHEISITHADGQQRIMITGFGGSSLHEHIQ